MKSNNNIPADEICIHASGYTSIYTLHWTIIKVYGRLSTFPINDHHNHKLAVSLSEVHLAYGGLGSFNLLCKNRTKTKQGNYLTTNLGLPKATKVKDLQIKLQG